MKFPSIKYSAADLIELLKINTSLMTNLPKNQLFVKFEIRSGQVAGAEIRHINGKVLEVNLEN